MDHRSTSSASILNSHLTSTSSTHALSLGSTIDQELELPRSHHLKSVFPRHTWEECRIVGLPDWLGWKLTGKWTTGVGGAAMNGLGRREASVDSKEFFRGVGLEEYISPTSTFNPLSSSSLLLSAGQPISPLSPSIANLFNLPPTSSITVASGAIDSHAGWIGTVAGGGLHSSLEDCGKRLSMVAGTSTCFVVQGKQKVYVEGIWGGFESAVHGEKYWMNEGGSSATGQLLDFIIETHPAYRILASKATQEGTDIYTLLNASVRSMAQIHKAPFLSYLTRSLHLCPDFHGNRSPLSDSHMRGMISGLRLDATFDDLVLKYLATLEALCFQAQHNLDALNSAGHEIEVIHMSGGLARNELMMELLANICKLPIQLPFYPKESVVLGSAILGAIGASATESGVLLRTQAEANENASSFSEDAWNMMARMTRSGARVAPNLGNATEVRLNEVKYRIYTDMIHAQKKWRLMVQESLQ